MMIKYIPIFRPWIELDDFTLMIYIKAHRMGQLDDVEEYEELMEEWSLRN